MKDVIKLEDIRRNFVVGDETVHALRGVSFTITEGEFVTIVGTSGSGKSTLLNILGCLDTPTSGEYYLDGVSVRTMDKNERATLRNRKIGFVFQSFNLLPRTTSLDNVIMPLAYTASGLSRKECRERGIEMLKRVGLSERIYHYPSQLSGGQQQRVAIARALINHPPVLFADEPTGNLDSHTSEEVMEMFSELNREGITVILVTHSTEIADFAKRSIHIQDGLVVNGEYRKGGSL